MKYYGYLILIGFIVLFYVIEGRLFKFISNYLKNKQNEYEEDTSISFLFCIIEYCLIIFIYSCAVLIVIWLWFILRK